MRATPSARQTAVRVLLFLSHLAHQHCPEPVGNRDLCIRLRQLELREKKRPVRELVDLPHVATVGHEIAALGETPPRSELQPAFQLASR